MFWPKDFYKSGVNNFNPVAIESLVVEKLVKEQFHVSSSCIWEPQLAPLSLDRPLHLRM